MSRILITGITGNLGKAAARLFLHERWQVYGVSRQESFIETFAGKADTTFYLDEHGFPTISTQEALENFDTGARKPGINLIDWAQTAAFIAKQEPFDIVFMTHGVQVPATLDQLDEVLWNQVVGNNLKSAVTLTTNLKRYNKVKAGGLIVYCSSIQAIQPREGRGLYAIAKAGLEALVRIAAVEFAPAVRAVGLRLGQMTGQMQGISFDPEAVKAIKEYTPLPWVSFEETARLVLALYEQQSLTGEIIEVSSGHKFSIWPK